MADACGELRQTLITRIEGMIHDVQRELHANNVEHDTLDGLFSWRTASTTGSQTCNRQCFRFECSELHHVRVRKINFLFTTSGK